MAKAGSNQLNKRVNRSDVSPSQRIFFFGGGRFQIDFCWDIGITTSVPNSLTTISCARRSFENEGLTVDFFTMLLIWWLKECGKQCCEAKCDCRWEPTQSMPFHGLKFRKKASMRFLPQHYNPVVV